MTEEAELSNEELAKELANGLVELHTDRLDGFAEAESFDQTMALLLRQLDEFSALQVSRSKRGCNRKDDCNFLSPAISEDENILLCALFLM